MPNWMSAYGRNLVAHPLDPYSLAILSDRCRSDYECYEAEVSIASGTTEAEGRFLVLSPLHVEAEPGDGSPTLRLRGRGVW